MNPKEASCRSFVAHAPFLDVREWSLGQDGLCNNTAERHHRQSGVRDFLQLHLIDLFLALSEEESGGIESVVTGLAAGSLQHLDDGDAADDLGEAAPQENLAHGTLFDEGVVGGDRGESLIGFGKGIDSESAVDGDEPRNGEHAYASVLQFGLPEEIHGDKVGESERIESDITDVSLEVCGVFEEGKGRAGLVRGTGIFLGIGSGVRSDGGGCSSWKVENERKP